MEHEFHDLEYLNYIGGKWVPAKSGEWMESIEPATGQVIGRVPKSGPEDVAAAVEAAKQAFDSWRLTPAPKRGEILFRVAQLLEERKEKLARFMAVEMGKVLPEARGDVQEAIDMAYYMAGEGRRLFGKTVHSELPNKSCWAERAPVGVVGVITPWNFPIAIPSWKILPALICGNTVVFKPASDTPMLGAEFVKIFEEAGLPPGVLNLVTGPGSSVGNAIVEHPDVKVISFTGSTESGRQVATIAAAQLKKVALEMGGKNAIIVMDDANQNLALEAVIWSAFGTTGQRCTACSRLILHRAIKDEFTERLVEATRALKLGHGLDPETDVGPVINAAALRKIHSYTAVAQQEGAAILVGGRIWENGGGFFYEPTLFDNVQPHFRVAQEEIFGPCLSIITADSLEEAIRINNSVAYGLSSSLFTQDVNRAFQAIRDFSTGLVYINHGTIGAETHLPFGGTNDTGNGTREAAWTALDTFSEWKTVYVDWSGRLQRAQIDTHEQ